MSTLPGLLFFFFSISFHASAQNQFLFKKIGQAQGLSSGSVTCFVQDNLGFIWIGTKKGLNRYDGFQFKAYDKKNSGLGAEDIADLLLDSKGRLWVGTIGGGLSRYDELKDDFVAYKNKAGDSASLSSNQVLKIFEDSRQNILIGTINGLNQFQEQTSSFKRYTVNAPNTRAINNSVSAIAEGQDGSLWLGSFGGNLKKLDLHTGNFEHHPMDQADNNLSTDYIYALQMISGNRLLIGTSGSGLLVFDIGKNQFSPFLGKEKELSEEMTVIRAIYQDSDGVLWIGTDGHGVLKVEEVGAENLKVGNYLNIAQVNSSLAGNAVYSIFEDREKNLWIGSAWSGISVLESNRSGVKFYYSDFTGENPQPVLSIYQDEQQLWLGSDGQGLTLFDYATRQSSAYLNGRQMPDGGSYIQLIKPDGQGNFWLGTFSNGLLLFHPQKGVLRHYRHWPTDPGSLGYNDVRDVLEDSLGRVWVATWGGGLCQFLESKGKFQRFMHDADDPHSISSNNVLTLRAADDGKIWIATFGGGLNLFDPAQKQFRRFRYSEADPGSICGDNLLSLLNDREGNLWIGAWGDGLCRLDIDKARFARFDEKDGIGDNTITALVADDAGNIWMSTKKGIAKYDKNTGAFTTFPELAGEYHINSAFKGADGQLYFGGIDGAIALDPGHLEWRPRNPRPQLTGFKLFNKEVKIGEKEILSQQILYEEKIVLNYSQDVITFEFAALQYPFSDDCEFAIFLDNFDKDWREIGNQRNATYTNLSPGEYQFRVKARNRGSDWSDEYASIEIEILKPYWATWWALGIYGILILALLYWFQKSSLRWAKMKNKLKLEQLSREKEAELHHLKQKFFTNISHEIRTPVTLILGAINRVNESRLTENQNKDFLAAIKKNGSHLLQLMNELLDINKLDAQGMQLDLARVDLVEYAQEIFLSFKSQAIQQGIHYHFEFEEAPIEVLIDADQMEKVLYNLLSNAFKFTDRGGSIRLSIRNDEGKACLSVRDSGQGIPPNQLKNIFKRFYQADPQESTTEKGYGIGLSIVRDIVHLHGGHIAVESNYGEGSCFTIRLEPVTNTEEEQGPIPGSGAYLAQAVEEGNRRLSEIPGISDTTILIVEDNPEISAYLKNWLQPKFKVLTAENGQTGLELARKHIPDLAISDVMMPVMDGISFTREMKTTMSTSHIPIIILTARTSLVYKKEGYETGADEYITKPFNEELLLARIGGLLRNREILREKFRLESIINPKELSINTPDQDFLRELMRIIEENIDQENLNASLLTRELGMSHSVVYKKIKALTGQSMVHFIRDFRLKRAAQLIEQYGFSVKEACYKVGFSDRRYFTRIFKERFGKAPSALKEE